MNHLVDNTMSKFMDMFSNSFWRAKLNDFLLFFGDMMFVCTEYAEYARMNDLISNILKCSWFLCLEILMKGKDDDCNDDK